MTTFYFTDYRFIVLCFKYIWLVNLIIINLNILRNFINIIKYLLENALLLRRLL